jgi:hypothetical protein
MKRKADNLQRHIDNTELLLAPQAADDRIIDRFETLMGRIKTWSLQFTADAQAFAVDEPSQEKLDIYRHVNAKCWNLEGLRKILREDKDRRLFARGLVAYVISITIFRPHDACSYPPQILEPKESRGYFGPDLWLREPLRGYIYHLERKLYDSGLSPSTMLCTLLTMSR